MKKFSCILLALLLILSLPACSKSVESKNRGGSDGSVSEPAEVISVVGKWVTYNGVDATLELNKDNSFCYISNGEHIKGQYEVQGNKLILSAEDSPAMECTIQNFRGFYEIAEWHMVLEENLEEARGLGKDFSILGRWVTYQEPESSFTFNEDGTVLIEKTGDSASGTYSVEGTELTIVLEGQQIVCKISSDDGYYELCDPLFAVRPENAEEAYEKNSVRLE